MEQRQPIFNAPGIVIAIIAVFALVHAGRGLLTETDDLRLLLTYGFLPGRGLVPLPPAVPSGSGPWIVSLFTHQLLHGDMTHLLINSAWLLVFGSIIARRIGPLRLVAFALACGVAGALAFWVAQPKLFAPLIGASGAISGLMGATFRFLFVLAGPGGLRQPPDRAPLMPLTVALRDRRVVGAILAYVAINLLFGLYIDFFAEAGTIAWEAHLGGFALGFLAFGLIDQLGRGSERVNEI